MSALAIDVQQLVKCFGQKIAVDHIDLQMPKGKVWGFLGPNGSGKTTTIRMICGLLKPTSGSGYCLGYDIQSEQNAIKLATGYMTQKFSFWEDLSIRENLEFVARLYHLPKPHNLVKQTLDDLGLSERQHQLAGTLSGGWKQRLALAAVTLHQPQLLLLDEPTAGVDPQARREFWDQIHQLANQGMTVLVSTHYMDEAERCDRIVYLADGKIITQGTVQQIIRESGLVTLRSQGDNIRQLAARFKQENAVEHAAYFGSALHISGQNRQALQEAAHRLTPEIPWQEVETTLEDTFIALTQRAGLHKEHL
ncbi:multidrug ABC transporter ATP-binding protein [Thiosulfatimonas sediminis]|uniref:Multidrug ABC transporter ATP-binding protein n=1 Tax=Thiosulfatimonas sediminis TaxID=2675054 RepID=A0A6F8PVF0_9GAMM|nr:ABC transporter ATP-binding protein [Thiosulfatimonas sediminis]BBP46017.1 multidrug ABC transporter ATP-binding protein [Thiosulfatimonas sediminis]